MVREPSSSYEGYGSGQRFDRETALRRVRRLAVSGLSLESFVRTLFAIVGMALPLGENQVLFADPRPPYTGYILSNPEIAEYNERNRRLNIKAPPEVSGVRNFNSPAMLAKPVWMHEEIALPHLQRSAAYDKVLRPLGMHHCMVLMFVEDGRLVGRWPMWRGAGMPEWNREDARFMATAAPYICHGLRLAQLAEPGQPSPEDFVPHNSSHGMVLLDRRGKLVAADARVRTMFAEFSAFDADAAAGEETAEVRQGLAGIAHALVQIFNDGGMPSSSVPATRVWSHRTGISLRLRGVALDAEGSCGRYFAVVVERGELEAQRRRRVMLSYGLSPTEFEVLRLIAAGNSRSEIAAALGLVPGTLKTHLKRLAEKLEVENYAALRRRAPLLLD
jgi:DNA-binding CsgD family transcriptional regulator